MTPKELLQKHGGDPLAAADALINKESTIDVGTGTRMESSLEGFIASGSISLLWAFVEYVIAHLGKDGAEKWGRALAIIALFHLKDQKELFDAEPIERIDLAVADVVLLANATDRERLAACLVALAEEERDA